MRLHEITQNVNEAVNFTRYIHDVENAIKQGILKSVDTLPKIKITSEMQDEIDTTNSFGSVKKKANLAKLMSTYCSVNLKNLAVKQMQVPVKSVIFAALENNHNGECTGLDIGLNINYINSISNKIWHHWSDTLHRLYDRYNQDDNDDDSYDDNYIDDYPMDYNELASDAIATFKNNLFLPNIEDTIDKCASTFIHEIVHARQHQAQYALGKDDDYRSYLKNKDIQTKQEFQDMIDTPGALDNPENYKLYRASPQEMAAFANQEAAKFIKVNGLNKPGVKPNAAIMSRLETHLGNLFRDRSNYKEYQLLKRYGTLIYKAVADYLNRKAELEKNQ